MPVKRSERTYTISWPTMVLSASIFSFGAENIEEIWPIEVIKYHKPVNRALRVLGSQNFHFNSESRHVGSVIITSAHT